MSKLGKQVKKKEKLKQNVKAEEGFLIYSIFRKNTFV